MDSFIKDVEEKDHQRFQNKNPKEISKPRIKEDKDLSRESYNRQIPKGIIVWRDSIIVSFIGANSVTQIHSRMVDSKKIRPTANSVDRVIVKWPNNRFRGL